MWEVNQPSNNLNEILLCALRRISFSLDGGKTARNGPNK